MDSNYLNSTPGIALDSLDCYPLEIFSDSAELLCQSPENLQPQFCLKHKSNNNHPLEMLKTHIFIIILSRNTTQTQN